MLFPYAQCNLRQYMRRCEFDISDQGNSLWLLDQLRSLADALRIIHNLHTGGLASRANLAGPASGMKKSGWHHDLKPENILCYRDRGSRFGKFCIADFGSGKVHTHRSGSINTGSKNGTVTYEPPEAQAEGRTSRPYDVFSLGCVFLELHVWAVCDYRSVKTFTSERSARRSSGSQEDDGFWLRTKDGIITIRKSVTNWIQRLKQIDHHYHEVLDLVMLMIELDKTKRITAVLLWNRLDQIYNKKKIDLETLRDGYFPKFKEPSQSKPRLCLNPPDRRTSEPLVPIWIPQSQLRSTSNAARTRLFYQKLTASRLERSPITARDKHRRNSSAASDSMLSVNSRPRNLSISSTRSHSEVLPRKINHQQSDVALKVDKAKSLDDLEISSLTLLNSSIAAPDRFESLSLRSISNLKSLHSNVEVVEALKRLQPLENPTHTFDISYVVTWELPWFLKTFFANDVRLGDVMTLTGGETEAYAVTCRIYLTKTWPEIADVLLQALENSLLPAPPDIVNPDHGMFMIFSLIPSPL
jgi:serine/threonine protein kinase